MRSLEISSGRQLQKGEIWLLNDYGETQRQKYVINDKLYKHLPLECEILAQVSSATLAYSRSNIQNSLRSLSRLQVKSEQSSNQV